MIELCRTGWMPIRCLRGKGWTLAVALAVPLAGNTPGHANGPQVGQPEPLQAPAVSQAAEAPPVYTLTLPEAINLAMQRQPALAAHRASLASAQTASVALERLRIPTFIARDLAVRRHQACLGVSIAAAALEQAEHDTVYAVTRTYFMVVYAREQEKVARETVENFKSKRDRIKPIVEKKGKEATPDDLHSVQTYLHLAEARHVQAAEGVKRALAALREAIGVGPDCCIQLPPGPLPNPQWQICCDDIVAWALARRGELVQTGLLAEVTSLEVDAQGTTHRVRKETFAAGADIHSKQVPQGEANGDYRPGAIPPEMPTLLAGCRSYRMERARALSSRAASVADKTRNLIALEAEDAYLKWLLASQQVKVTQLAVAEGNKLNKDRNDRWLADQDIAFKDVLSSEVLGAQSRAQLNEALFHQILALAALERVTAGGFCAELSGTPTVATPSEPAKEAPAAANAIWLPRNH
jgi:outer membrane protein TolC